MAINFYGSELTTITYSGTELTEITFNGTVVWSGLFTFTQLTTDTCSVKAKSGKTMPNKVVIPSSYKGMKVTTVEEGGFANQTGIEILTIPDTVTNIGKGAFEGCNSIREISMPLCNDYLGYIFGADNYFENDDYVPTSLSVVTITSSIFTTFPENYFRYCTNISSIRIYADNITEMGRNIFYSLDSLIEIVLPPNISQMSWNVITFCDNLVRIYYMGDEASWNNITITASSGNVSAGSDKNWDILTTPRYYYSGTKPSSRDTHWFLYNNEPHMWILSKSHSFFYYEQLDDGTWDISVNNILPPQATSITLPSKYDGLPVTAIRDKGCIYITQIKTIILPDTIRHIGSNAFHSNIENVYLNQGLISIADEAFLDDSKMVEITIPSSVTTIGANAFSGCSNLTIYCEATSIPSGWDDNWNPDHRPYYLEEQIVEEEAYEEYLTYTMLDNGTYSVSAIDVDNLPSELIIPNWYKGRAVTEIGDFSWSSCYTHITIPKKVITISDYAFQNCSNFTFTFEENGELKTIGDEAFYECTSIDTLTLPNGLETIGRGAFALSTIISIDIPDSVKKIDDECFYESSLKTITFGQGSKLTDISGYAFYDTEISSIDIPDGVTDINERAFAYCQNLTTVTFGENSKLHRIWERAFLECGITTMSIPLSCSVIGDGAFAGCTNLNSITFPNKYIHFGEEHSSSVFSRTSYVTDELNWRDGLLYLGIFLIQADPSITGECTVREGTKYIFRNAFDGCTGITKLILPSTIESIDEDTFSPCTSLETVIFAPPSKDSSGSTSSGTIQAGGFRGCAIMHSIYVPVRMNRIKSNAFAGCDNVTVYFEAESQPDEFYEDWNSDNVPVVWGYCYHTYESVVTEPTCTEQGYTTHTCSKCGDSYIDSYTDALGHDWDVEVEVVEPTCTTGGYTIHTCNRCGTTYKDNYTDALGHTSSDWIIDKQPTVEAEGSKHKECTRCGATLETATIPKVEDTNTYLVTESGDNLTDEQGNLLIL